MSTKLVAFVQVDSIGHHTIALLSHDKFMHVGKSQDTSCLCPYHTLSLGELLPVARQPTLSHRTMEGVIPMNEVCVHVCVWGAKGATS
jgi:hypothetical protein